MKPIVLSPTDNNHCFVCDKQADASSLKLQNARTDHSRTDVPFKIGQLMGDGFMVIVTSKDLLCETCFALMNELDRLECDVLHLTNILKEQLRAKYNLEDDFVYDCQEPDFHQIREETHVEPERPADSTTVNEKITGSEAEDDSEFGSESCDAYSGEIGGDEQEENEEELKEVVVDSSELGVTIPTDLKDGLTAVGLQIQIDNSDYQSSNGDVFQADDQNSQYIKYNDTIDSFALNHCDDVNNERPSEFINNPVNNPNLLESKVPAEKEMHSEIKTDSDFMKTSLKVPLKLISREKRKIDTIVPPSDSYLDIKNMKKDQTTYQNVKMYDCIMCPKRFRLEKNFLTHMTTHAFFKCGICSLPFQNKSNLLNHFSTHKFANKIEFFEVNGNCYEPVTQEIYVVNMETKQELTETQLTTTSEENSEKSYIMTNQFTDCGQLPLLDNPENASGVEIPEVSPKQFIVTTDEQINNHVAHSINVENDVNSNTLEERSELIEHPSNFIVSEILEQSNDESNEIVIDSSNQAGEVSQNVQSLLESNGFQENISEENAPKAGKKNIYMCPFCGIKINSKADFELHFKNHVPVNKQAYRCVICGRTMTTLSNLKRHMVNHHKYSGNEVCCGICNKTLSDRLHLKFHIQEKHPETHPCSFCEKIFTNKKLCKSHELTHPENPIYLCEICNKIFESVKHVENHKIVAHKEFRYSGSNEKKLICSTCLKEFKSYNNLKRHLRYHESCSSPIKCELCSEIVENELKFREHVKLTHPGNYQCSFCTKTFISSQHCRDHEVIHPEHFIFHCRKCNKSFINERALIRHTDLVHRDMHCRICGKEVHNPKKLRQHEMRHERLESFPCSECSKVFKNISGLKYHMSVHTGNYANYCEICGKGFNSDIALVEHRATHTKETRFMCELCGRKFSSNSTYRTHRKWHDDLFPYRCNICNRKFKHTSILAVHKRRVHTGERPYKCSFCSLSFSVSNTLKKHVILHTKQYPHKCKTCGKGFITRFKYVKHMAKQHLDFNLATSKPNKCEYKMALKPSEMIDVEKTKDKFCQEDNPDFMVVEVDGNSCDVLEEVIIDQNQQLYAIF